MDLSALLDEISSARSTWSHRSQALNAVEHLLATACSAEGLSNAFHAFIVIQNTFESNVASRLVAALTSWLPILQDSVHNTNDSKLLDTAAEPAVLQPIMQALSILQGVSLLHEPSKAFLGRRWCIQLFLDLISASKHIPSAPDALDSTPLVGEGLLPPTSNLANSVLDTLLCVLVDTPEATRCFEEAGGLDVLVRTLKRAGVSRDVRMKCLEFLYFYLLPEGDNVGEATSAKAPDSHALSTPPTTSPELSSSLSSDTPFESDDTFAPNPKVAELRMLQRDIDFMPVTPIKKGHVANLGLGTPFNARGPLIHPKTPTKKRKQDADSGTTTTTSSSSLDDSEPSIEPRTPRREHLRGRSDVTLVSGYDGGRTPFDADHVPQDKVPRTPTKTSRYTPGTPGQPKTLTVDKSCKSKTPTRLHTRGTSTAGSTLVGYPMHSKRVGLLSLDEGLVQLKEGGDGRRIRSTTEKTALLSNYLGNVGALVEGMKKAGAWGLE